MMDGTPSAWNHFIGLSWSAPGGVFQLTLLPIANIFFTGIDSSDAVVSDSTTSVVPETGTPALMLTGLGALTLLRRRIKNA